MIVVLADVYAQAPHRAQVREAMLASQAAARAEDGCLSYTFAETLEEPGHYILQERWRDGAALEAHFRGAGLAAYREAVTPLLVRDSEVRVFTVETEVRPVGASPEDPREDG